jgi:hypothetical protein
MIIVTILKGFQQGIHSKDRKLLKKIEKNGKYSVKLKVKVSEKFSYSMKKMTTI